VVLLSQGSDNRHNVFNKRFYNREAHKGPQGNLSFEDVVAITRGFAVAAVRTLARQLAYLALNS
jgi:hypothetical protein